MSESKGIVIEEQELREMARPARGAIQHIYLHWSGGHYGDIGQVDFSLL